MTEYCRSAGQRLTLINPVTSLTLTGDAEQSAFTQLHHDAPSLTASC